MKEGRGLQPERPPDGTQNPRQQHFLVRPGARIGIEKEHIGPSDPVAAPMFRTKWVIRREREADSRVGAWSGTCQPVAAQRRRGGAVFGHNVPLAETPILIDLS